jgi:hypothetical protein
VEKRPDPEGNCIRCPFHSSFEGCKYEVDLCWASADQPPLPDQCDPLNKRILSMDFVCHNPKTAKRDTLSLLPVVGLDGGSQWVVFDPTKIDPITGGAKQVTFRSFRKAMRYIRETLTEAVDAWIDRQYQTYEKVDWYSAP